jgi:hypothetical protein
LAIPRLCWSKDYSRTAVTDIGSLLDGISAEVAEPAGGVVDEREAEAATWTGEKQVFLG